MPRKIPIRMENPSLVNQGTYSQAVRHGELIFVTGQTGRDPRTGKLEEGLEAQTRRVLSNVDAILGAAGRTKADLLKVTLMLVDIRDFKAVDDIYKTWLPAPEEACRPARSAFQAAALPAGALLELEVIASAGQPSV